MVVTRLRAGPVENSRTTGTVLYARTDLQTHAGTAHTRIQAHTHTTQVYKTLARTHAHTAQTHPHEVCTLTHWLTHPHTHAHWRLCRKTSNRTSGGAFPGSATLASLSMPAAIPLTSRARIEGRGSRVHLLAPSRDECGIDDERTACAVHCRCQGVVSRAWCAALLKWGLELGLEWGQWVDTHVATEHCRCVLLPFSSKVMFVPARCWPPCLC